MKTSNAEHSISWTSGINLIAGIWLFISTWAVTSELSAARTNDLVFGIVITVLAFIRLSSRSRSGVSSWLNLIAGLWLIAAPFVLHFQTEAQKWNSIIVGIVVGILAIASGTAGATRTPATTA